MLDAGCGTGAHLPRFAGRFDVTGVDLSPHMQIAAARASGVAAMRDAVTTVEERHVMRLSDPGEFAAAFERAGLTFERLPHTLRPGRSVYAGVKR
jgi:SAM-dependent methyltransferase